MISRRGADENDFDVRMTHEFVERGAGLRAGGIGNLLRAGLVHIEHRREVEGKLALQSRNVSPARNVARADQARAQRFAS